MSQKTGRILVRISVAIIMMLGFRYWQNSNSHADPATLKVVDQVLANAASSSSVMGSSAETDQKKGGLTSEANSVATNSPLQIPQIPTSPAELTPEQIQHLVAGTWESEYYGKRYLTIRNDGTATIYYQASTLASMLVGNRLRIEYEWAYDEKARQVVFTIVDGAPRKGLDYVIKTWGLKQRQDVVSVCQQELNFLDLDGETKHRWKQLNQIPADVQSRFEKL